VEIAILCETIVRCYDTLVERPFTQGNEPVQPCVVAPKGDETSTKAISTKAILIARLGMAVVQAAVLYGLATAAMAPWSWPATEPALFEPLLLAAVYIPLLTMLGIGKVQVRPLIVWVAAAGLVIAGLGYHDAARGRVLNPPFEVAGWPWLHLWIALTLGLFVAHVLVTDSITERRLLPAYPRHFDTAWKLGVQSALALVFVAVFWGVLELGAELFNLIAIDAFSQLLAKRWFDYPATCLALAVAIHATDVQPALIRGARSVALVLFSWLTPLLALIVGGFIVSLPFVSLAPLWHTHWATGLMLGSASTMIFLINTCYQDGADEQTTSRLKRLAGTLGAIELVPLAALSAWGLGLRISQYGWSVERITVAALIFIISCYALGYATAVVARRGWLKRVETTNWVSAYIGLALLLALFSPIADPARLMVADQIHRLESGAASPQSFDFVALRFDGARWGAAALDDLRHGPLSGDAAVQAHVVAVLIAPNRSIVQQPPSAASLQQLADDIAVYPVGRALPPGFLEPAFAAGNGIPQAFCANARTTATACFARYVTLHPGQPDAIILVASYSNAIFEQNAQGQWRKTGTLTGPFACIRALRSDSLTLEPPATPDLVVDGYHMAFTPVSPVIGACEAEKRPN
jgi:hypothetical protein